jgi:hypothetical protein
VHCKEKEPKVDYIEFTAGSFDIDIHVFITQDTNLVKLYEPSMNFNSAACTVYDQQGGPISVWFPRVDTTLESRLTVIHEMQHITHAVLQCVGLNHNIETDEVYSYELEYLIKQLYTHMK